MTRNNYERKDKFVDTSKKDGEKVEVALQVKRIVLNVFLDKILFLLEIQLKRLIFSWV